MLRTPLFVKKTLSWFLAVLGIIIGYAILVGVSQAYIHERTSPERIPEWLEITLFLCLAFVFLIASFIALRNRLRSGLVFLICAPSFVFCFTYFGGIPGPDGIVYSLTLWTALKYCFLFFLPFLVALISRQNKTKAICLFLISVFVVGVVFRFSQWAALLPWFAGWSAPFFLFGLFWLGTHKFGWPPLLAARPRSLKRRIATVLIGCLVLATLDVVATFVAAAWTSSSVSLSCNDVLPFSQPKRPDHEVFIARLVRVGHSQKISGRWVGEWAIGRIEEKFWGLPWWTPRFVLLTDDIFWEGETYFIDGERASRLLPHVLPIVVAGPCGRTRPLVNAAVDVYLLRETSSAGGARIVGYVQNGDPIPWYSAPPVARTPVSGAKVSLTGSFGTRTTFTDHEGIYEFDGLTADDYDIVLTSPDTQISEKRKVGKDLLESYRLLEIDFSVSPSDTTGSK